MIPGYLSGVTGKNLRNRRLPKFYVSYNNYYTYMSFLLPSTSGYPQSTKFFCDTSANTSATSSAGVRLKPGTRSG